MTDNVTPIRSSAAETIELHQGLIEAIQASGDSVTEAIGVIRRAHGDVSPALLDAMEAAHLRLVSVALLLARSL